MQRITAAAATYKELTQHAGQTEQQGEKYINENKSRPPILAGCGGETPDIAQSDGGTGGGKYHAELGTKVYL